MGISLTSGTSRFAGITGNAGISFLSGVSGSNLGGSINTNPRNIASGMRGSSEITSGTTDTMNYRTSHYNDSGVDVTSLSIMYAGWYVNSTNEAASPDPYTVTASIEYPSGTFTQVTWSSATSKVINPGDNIMSDYIAVTIPANTQFWIRTFISVTLGDQWPRQDVGPTTANGENCEFGIGLTDKTMGGSISGTSLGTRPLAAVAPWVSGMRSVSLCGFGDSTIVGTGDGTFDSRGNTSWSGKAASGRCPYVMLARAGSDLSTNAPAGEMDYRLDFLQKAGITDVILSLAANDIASGIPLATMQGYAETVIDRFVDIGARVHYSETGPRSTSTDNWYTTTNQTASVYWDGSSAVGHEFNDWLDTLPAGLTSVFQKCELLSTSKYSGIWRTGDSSAISALLTSSNLTLTGTPTTTSLPFTPSLASGNTNVFTSGRLDFTSGVLNGTSYTAGITNTLSTITCTTALSSAPSAGDTLIARPTNTRSTTDGIHGVRSTANGSATAYSGMSFGGQVIMREAFEDVIDAWLA